MTTGDTPDMATSGTAQTSSGRVLAFRIIAIVGAVFLGGVSIVFLVLGYLDEEEEIHALHNLAAVASYVPLMAVPLVAAAKDPAGSIASFRVAVAATVGLVIAGAIGGTFETTAITLVVVLVLVWLHPTRNEVLRLGALDLPLLALVVVAAIPAIVYGVDQADLQASRPAADPHVEFEHYAGMAGGAFGFILAGAVASFRGRGDRIARWLVGLGGALTGAAYLLYPDHVSGIDPAWAAAALVVSVIYLAFTETLERRSA